MTVAVLKNRLKTETHGAFNERTYGARNIAEFVRAFPDLVKVDFDRPYPLVTLLESAVATNSDTTEPGTDRLRPDLWRALFDYRSGETFVLDASRGLAVPEGEGLVGARLPTLSEAELDAWRETFAASERARLEGFVREQLDEWQRARLPTRALPVALRPLWNRFMTQKALERLRAWFEDHGLPIPEDLTAKAKPLGKSLEEDYLRRFVQACVARMSLDELRSLHLPAAVAARVTGRDARA
jgi:hypothetical protein